MQALTLELWVDTVQVRDLGPDNLEKAKTVKSYDAFRKFLQETIGGSPKIAI